MTKVATTDLIYHPISELKGLRYQLAFLEGLLMGVLLFIVTFVTAAWLDLIVELESGFRLTFVIASVLAAITSLVVFMIRCSKKSDTSELAADLDRVSDNGGVLATCLGLLSFKSNDNCTQQLLDKGLDDYSKSVGEMEISSAVSGKKAKGFFLWIMAMGFFLLVGAMAWPNLARTQAMRLLDPYGDHPPYSPYQLSIVSTENEVVFGKTFRVEVQLEGPETEESPRLIIEQDGQVKSLPLIDRGNGRYAGMLAAVEKPFTFYAKIERARSHKNDVKVVFTPRFEKVLAEMKFPAYSGMSDYKGLVPEAGLYGLKRTLVTLRFKSNRPLAGGDLVLKSKKTEKTLPLTVDAKNPKEAFVTFKIMRDMRLTARLLDVDQRYSETPFVCQVRRQSDQVPLVSIIQPPRQSFAIPTTRVPLFIEVEDDFGISEVTLVMSINESNAVLQHLLLPEDTRQPFLLSEKFDMKALGVDPDDRIEYYVIVTDNRPEPEGGQKAYSEMHELNIISEEVYAAFVRQQEQVENIAARYEEVQNEMQELIEKAKEASKKLKEATLKKDEKKAKEAEEKLEELKEAMEKMAEKMKKQSEEVPIHELDEEFQKQLAEMAKNMKELAEMTEKVKKDLKKAEEEGWPEEGETSEKPNKGMKEIMKKLGEEQEQKMQEMKEALELLEAAQRLLEEQARFVQLALAQDDLAKRLQRFKDSEETKDLKEKRELRNLGREQEKLIESLAKLASDIRDHCSKLPKEEPYEELVKQALEFVKKLEESGYEPPLENARTAMGKAQGKNAYTGAREGADILLALIEESQQSMGEGGQQCLKFKPSFAGAMQGTSQQMLKNKGLPSMGQGQNGVGAGAGGYSVRTGMPKSAVYGHRPNKGKGGGLDNNKKPPKGKGSKLRQRVNAFPGGVREDESKKIDVGTVPWESVPMEYRSSVRGYYRMVIDKSENMEEEK